MTRLRVLYVAPGTGSVERTGDRLGDLGEDATFSTAETGARALSRLDDAEFDCVVAPVELPETDGLTLLERVREAAPALPVVLVAGSGRDDAAGVESGDDAADEQSGAAADEQSGDDAADEQSGDFAREVFSTPLAGYVHRVEAGADPALAVAGWVRRLVEQARAEREAVAAEREAVAAERPQLERRYSAVVDAVNDGVADAVNDGVVVVRDGEIKFVNDAFAELCGYERDDLSNEPVTEFVAPEDRQTLRDRYERLPGETVDEPLEVALLSKAGERVPVEVDPTAFGDEDGSATFAVVRNLREPESIRTRLMQTNRRLRAHREYTSRILDSVDDVFFIVNDDGTLRWWNQAASDLWGYTVAEARSTPIVEFFRDDQAERIREHFREVRTQGSTRTEVTVVTGDGEEIPYEFVANALADSRGDRIVAGTGRDVTERTERERQLQVIDRVLRHNLHNDMAVVQGHAEQIRRFGSEEVAAYATKIIRRSDRLLDTAKKERGVVEILLRQPSPTTLDLGTVVSETVDSMRETYPEARIRTSVPVSASVFALSTLATAVEELVENAIRYNDRERPTVDVSVARVDEAVTLRVADDGPGIPEQERKVLTGEREIGPLYHGSGLGLWLVHWIVDRSGGSLRFAENSPRGSIVTVELRSSPGGDGPWEESD
ncbi:MAG: PAS domain S-box protein [Haloferacaceae archaeon]